jgi:hypothetical protein
MSELTNDVWVKFDYVNIAIVFRKKYVVKINKIKNNNVNNVDRRMDAREFDELLTPESQKRRRFRFNYMLTDYNAPDISLAAGLYLKLLMHIGKSDLIDKWSLEYVFFDMKLAKELSDMAFLCGEALDKDWRLLVHITRLQDYRPDLDFEALLEAGINWVTPKMHTFDDSEELFYEEFKKSVYTVFNNINSAKNVENSVSDWLNDRTKWGGTGASFSDEGVTDKGFNKTKWNFAWNNGLAALKHLYWRKRKQMASMFIKREATKSRGVVGSDMATYLKMKYISDNWLTSYFFEDDRSTLWMTTEQRIRFWERMTIIKGWRMPLDQSGFDQNQTLKQVLIVLDVLIDKASTFAVGENRDDLINSVMLLRYSLDGGQMVIKKNEAVKKLEIKNGVMSGWYWTAFMDTILNLATLETAKKWCAVHGLPVNITSFCAQGDDDHLEMPTKKECVMLWLAYQNFGFDVNPSKFYISRTRDEFLRKSISNGRTDGYPARSILSLLWRNPVGDADAVGRQRLDSILTRWKLLSDRLDVQFLEEWAMSDMLGSIDGIPATIIYKWLHTPRTYSGGGVKPWSRDWYNITDSKEIKTRRYENQSVKEFISYHQVTDYSELIYDYVATTLKEKKKKPQYERAIARSIQQFQQRKKTIVQGIKIPRPAWTTGSQTVYNIVKDDEYLLMHTRNGKYYLQWLNGFSNKMKMAITTEEGAVGPFIKGKSLEYTSSIASFYTGSILQLIRNSKGGYNYYKEVLLYLENNLFLTIKPKTFLDKDYAIAE